MKFLKRLLSGGSGGPPSAPFTAELAPDERIYVTGDLHGRADLLERCLERLGREPAGRYVFVGDYSDRGDQSAAVLKRLMGLCAVGDDTVCLMGNHEKMLLDFLDRPAERGRLWLRNGGLQTLASFGVGGLTMSATPDDIAIAASELRVRMAAGLEDWLRALPLAWQSGNLWVVHAGADPAQPMQAQKSRVLIWGHPAFSKAARTDGQWVAHGHTIVEAPSAADGRISVDTGAFATGRLTTAVLEPGAPVRFFEA